MPRPQSIPNGSRCRLGVHTRSSHKIDRLGLESRSFETSFADARTTCRRRMGFRFGMSLSNGGLAHRSWARAALGAARISPMMRAVRRADLPSGDPTTAIAGVRHVSLLSRSPAWGQQQHAIRRTGECDQRCNDQAFACKNLTASMRLPSGSRIKAA